MTAGQFFLCLVIIIILKESLASAAAQPAGEAASPTTSSDDPIATSESRQTTPGDDDGSSMFPAVNMGVAYGFEPLHAPPAPAFVRGKLNRFACINIIILKNRGYQTSVISSIVRELSLSTL